MKNCFLTHFLSNFPGSEHDFGLGVVDQGLGVFSLFWGRPRGGGWLGVCVGLYKSLSRLFKIPNRNNKREAWRKEEKNYIAAS